MAITMQHARGHHESAGEGHGAQAHGHNHAAMIADFRRRFWVSLVLTVPIVALSPMFQGFFGIERALGFPGDAYFRFALASGVYFYGGMPFIRGMMDELGRREPAMMTLIALAISVAYFYSSAVVFGVSGKAFFWELATLIDVMLLGHWIEMRSVMGASGALEELARLLPSTAHRLKDSGDTEDVPVSDLRPGDRVLVKPGEKVPTDGVIAEGHSSLNESLLTGESKPVTRGKGEEAVGGAVNGEGSLVLEIRKTGDETYLSQVIDTVRRAQESRSRSQDIANRAARWLTYIALSVGGLTLLVWLFVGYDFEFSLERMVTVMVITCPHALGLAVPLVVAVSTSMAAGRGLLIRDRASFEQARNLDAIVFDKTGTLTEGRFGVADVISLVGDENEDGVLALAAAVESQSEHPIARGITEEAKARELAIGKVTDFENITGEGASAKVDGRPASVVSPSYLSKKHVEFSRERIDELEGQGKTVVVVVAQERPVGAIALADVVRRESNAAIKALKDMGVRCMMLTGDAEAVAKSVAEELGIDEFFARVLPDQKAEKIKEVKERGMRVAMVGDGVNDAPALVASDLGIAIGAGTDVAIESADIVLVRNDPRDVAAITALARATYGKMVQNLLWATGYNAIAIPLAAGLTYGLGFVLSPAVGAALMSISTVIVAINAKLLERKSGGSGSG